MCTVSWRSWTAQGTAGHHCPQASTPRAWPAQLCRGIFRWDICFNLTILRMLSFALDSHRLACARRKLKGMRHEDDLSVAGAGAASRVSSPIVPPHQQQTAQTLTRDSDVLVYFAYLFYPPLYLAGPILTFQDFLTQLHHGPTLPIRQARQRMVCTCLAIAESWH